MKIGLIREGKVPADARVALTPAQCKALMTRYPQLEIFIQQSAGRCIPDAAYTQEGLPVVEDVSHCDVLMGIKEVPIAQLIADKTYLFFSHTIKAQPYNRKLLQTVLARRIRLIDYEVLTNNSGRRLIAFGRFAGIVGAHNGMMAYGTRTGAFDLAQMHKYDDYAAAIAAYQSIDFPSMRIVVTGTGRVSQGAVEVLKHMNIQEVSPEAFLNDSIEGPVFTQLSCTHYATHKTADTPFDKQDFYKNPQDYRSTFAPYTRVADLMINGIYWDPRAPQFFTAEAMKQPEFSIQVIADVTCDIAPEASIPSTLLATTIAEPVFGYNPQTQQAEAPYQPHTIDVMSIDNLPNELPKDASASFGTQFSTHIIEELLGLQDNGVIARGTIAQDGALTEYFQYLQSYVNMPAQ